MPFGQVRRGRAVRAEDPETVAAIEERAIGGADCAIRAEALATSVGKMSTQR